MPLYRSHLTVLEASAQIYPDASAFRLPQPDEDGRVRHWSSITYRQFLDDVERFARHWSRTLASDGVPRRSVVGLWLGGMGYADVLHVYGLSRAGYIPQLFSLRLPNPDVIFELLHRSNGKALIHDPSFQFGLRVSPVPTHSAIGLHEANPGDEPLPPMPAATAGEETVVIFHTSGSTSGSPKLVPCSRIWMDAMVSKSYHVSMPKDRSVQVVSSWMGSVCHIAQTFMLLGSLQHGSCTIQPTKIGFASDELLDMIDRCKLNRLTQFATFLGIHLRNARLNPKLLAQLRALDQVVYSGLALPREEEEFAIRSGLKLINLFGSTECGAMLLSSGESSPQGRFLRPIETTSYGFFPVAPVSPTESGHKAVNAQLLELVILKESGDCPDHSLRHADGHFHTGDLFQEVAPGQYVSRGRDDDWIKSENSLRCDTKAIEDNVRAMCKDLISECIVVGNGRPSPVLFVEPADANVDQNKLKKEIIRKTRHFHSRRYIHERITSPDMVIVVPTNTLPRTATKGNIRRKAVEEQFKERLDRLFACP